MYNYRNMKVLGLISSSEMPAKHGCCEARADGYERIAGPDSLFLVSSLDRERADQPREVGSELACGTGERIPEFTAYAEHGR